MDRRFISSGVLAALVIAAPLAVGVSRAAAVGFAPRVYYTTGAQPLAIAVGDFNGDGKQDLATANNSGNTVTVLFGNGDGAFPFGYDVSVDDGPCSVAVADFNDDGDQDLVTTSTSSDTLSYLPGWGDGSFGLRTDIAISLDPRSVAVGDFNGDGKQDLAVARSGGDDVLVELGDGTGGVLGTGWGPTGDTPWSVAVGDSNGDGKQDLVTANYFGNTVSVLLGSGTGLDFAGNSDFAVGPVPTSVAVGDFNHDGAQDLVTASGVGTVSVLLGSGTGSFAARTDFMAGIQLTSVAVGDFNGDGKQDLAVTDASFGAVSVLLGSGNGNFANPSWFSAGSSPRSLAVGDFNRDGRQDLAVADNVRAVVLLNSGTAPTGTMRLAGGDAAAAGRLVRIDSAVTDAVEMAIRDAGGSWSSWQPYSAQVYWTLPAGDGSKTVEVRYRNEYNQVLTLSDAILLDTTPPTTTDDAGAGWHNSSPVTVTFKSGDGTGSGVAATQYKLDGAADWTTDTGAGVGVAGDGSHTLKYRSVDAAGNKEETQIATVKIDTHVPDISLLGVDDQWHAGPVMALVQASDSLSGLQAIAFNLDSAGWTLGSGVLVTADGDHVLQYTAIDNAGNTDATQTAHIRIDTTAPVTTDDAPATWTNAAVTITLTPIDEGSGMSGGAATTEHSTDGGTTWATGATVTVDPDPVGHTTDGLVVRYRSTDAIGNVEATKSCTARIDTRGPTTSGAKLSVLKGKKATFKFKVTDPQPGSPLTSADPLKPVKIKIRDSRGKLVKTLTAPEPYATNVTVTLGWAKCRLAKGTYKYKVYACDQAGNPQVKAGGNKLIVR